MGRPVGERRVGDDQSARCSDRPEIGYGTRPRRPVHGGDSGEPGKFAPAPLDVVGDDRDPGRRPVLVHRSLHRDPHVGGHVEAVLRSNFRHGVVVAAAHVDHEMVRVVLDEPLFTQGRSRQAHGCREVLDGRQIKGRMRGHGALSASRARRFAPRHHALVGEAHLVSPQQHLT